MVTSAFRQRYSLQIAVTMSSSRCIWGTVGNKSEQNTRCWKAKKAPVAGENKEQEQGEEAEHVLLLRNATPPRSFLLNTMFGGDWWRGEGIREVGINQLGGGGRR
jgi:hypothetical protein